MVAHERARLDGHAEGRQGLDEGVARARPARHRRWHPRWRPGRSARRTSKPRRVRPELDGQLCHVARERPAEVGPLADDAPSSKRSTLASMAGTRPSPSSSAAATRRPGRQRVAPSTRNAAPACSEAGVSTLRRVWPFSTRRRTTKGSVESEPPGRRAAGRHGRPRDPARAQIDDVVAALGGARERHDAKPSPSPSGRMSTSRTFGAAHAAANASRSRNQPRARSLSRSSVARSSWRT